MNFADVRIDQFAFGGDDHRKRHANELDARRLGNRHCVLLANQNRVIELRFFGVGR